MARRKGAEVGADLFASESEEEKELKRRVLGEQSERKPRPRKPREGQSRPRGQRQDATPPVGNLGEAIEQAMERGETDARGTEADAFQAVISQMFNTLGAVVVSKVEEFSLEEKLDTLEAKAKDRESLLVELGKLDMLKNARKIVFDKMFKEHPRLRALRKRDREIGDMLLESGRYVNGIKIPTVPPKSPLYLELKEIRAEISAIEQALDAMYNAAIEEQREVCEVMGALALHDAEDAQWKEAHAEREQRV